MPRLGPLVPDAASRVLLRLRQGLAASSTSRVERRSRARAASRLASAGRTGASGARQTRSTVSSSVVDDALPATFRARARDEDETAQISPQLGCCHKAERR